MSEGLLCRACGKRVPLVEAGEHEVQHEDRSTGPGLSAFLVGPPRDGGKIDTRPPDETGMDRVDLHDPESLSKARLRPWREPSR